MNQASSTKLTLVADAVDQDVEIALFPIPELVAFPGTVIPLHVFEPRYRKMVHDCSSSGRMIGICHTVKEIHAAKPKQTQEEALATTEMGIDRDPDRGLRFSVTLLVAGI